MHSTILNLLATTHDVGLNLAEIFLGSREDNRTHECFLLYGQKPDVGSLLGQMPLELKDVTLDFQAP